MDFLTTTKRYYAAWLDTAPDNLDVPGIQVLYSSKRNERQAGYARPFDLYAFATDSSTILSYGQRLKAGIHTIERCFAQAESLELVKSALLEQTGNAPHHALKFVFTGLPGDLDTSLAQQLGRDDYPDYLRFHQACYPGANAASWLEDYFDEIAGKGYVFGVYADGVLVSATDAPSMPYMDDQVVEPGINTLREYRKQGYAKIVCSALLKYLLSTRKVPLWSCTASNIASRKLAESLGFVKLADVITL